ncbi:MAG TPA: hypothetical protein DDW52_01805 [Planctomycetaceae bacterium]|nr:hypothetical protein [Planctomycetaceae bacterium]
MLHSDRSHLSRFRQKFLLALSIGLGTCATALCDEKPAGNDGTVSIRLMLEPSLPAKGSEGTKASEKNGNGAAELSQESKPGSTAAGASEIDGVAEAVTAKKTQRWTLLAKPVDAPAPQPGPGTRLADGSKPADDTNREVARSEPQQLQGAGDSTKVEAQPVTVPSRRFLQRRNRSKSNDRPTAQRQQTQQKTAKPADRKALAPAMQPIADPITPDIESVSPNTEPPLKTARVQTSRVGTRAAEPAPLPPGSGVRKLGPAKIQRTPIQALDEDVLSLDSGHSSKEEPVDRLAAEKQDSGSDDANSDAIEIIDLDAIETDGKNSQATKESDGECPGSPDGPAAATEMHLDDIPLEETEHPYDAPRAKRTDEREISSSRTPSNSPELVEEQFTSRELEIRDGINRCLNYFLTHPENVVRRGPWALMHAALPFGVETEVIAGRRRVNAIGWMCFNGVCAKQRMFQPTRSGFRTNLGPGVQGHEGQFLAILAQSHVSRDYPLKIGNRSYKVEDLIRYEMATCRERSELTFKLIGLAHYLPGDSRWRDNRGRIWNLEKMVKEELAQPIQGAACGGTHRLMGLTYALLQRQRDGLPITGHWQRAEIFLKDYIRYAFTLQNPDGSFSTEWFEGRGMERDVERKVQTTGHILEWLIYALPEDSLRNPRIQLSVEFLINSVGRNPTHDWPIGPRGHALRAMALYNQRVFGAEVGQMTEYIASTPANQR